METVEFDDLLWVVDDTVDNHLPRSKHEWELLYDQLDQFPKGGYFFDVGAQGGGWTLRFADKAREVTAFEPLPANRALLKKNLKVNNVTNVTVLPFALGASEAWSFLESAGGSTRVMEYGTVPAHIMALDAFQYEHIDLIKIDVEGMEGEVIRGATETLRRTGAKIFLELHDKLYGDDIYAQTLSGLDAAGYTWKHVGNYGAGRYFECYPR